MLNSFNMQGLLEQTLKQSQQDFESSREQIAKARERILAKDTEGNLPEEYQSQINEIVAILTQNVDLIEPVGLFATAQMIQKQEVHSILSKHPDLRFEMAQFLKQKAGERETSNEAAQ